MSGSRAGVPARSPVRVQKVSTAGGARGGLANSLSLALVLCGGVAVLAAFFMDWLAFSLPAVGMLLGSSTPLTISGYDLVMMGPGTYRSVPVILVVLIPGLGALGILVSGLRVMPESSWRPFLGIAQLLMGAAGLVALAALLTAARSEPQQMLGELGLKGAIPSLLSAALVRIEPGSGYGVSLGGFALLVIGGLADFVFHSRSRHSGI